jgi:hypothetical protein
MSTIRADGRRRPRRPLLAIVGASIAVNAALGIYALVVPHFGSLQGRVLATSACVTGAGVLTLACLPAWERRRLSILPRLGVATTPVGFALIVVGLWAGIDNSAYGKALGTVLVVAVVCVIACVLSLAELAPRYRRAFPVADGLAVLLGAMIVGGIWSGFPGSWYGRAAGVVAVLFAAATVSVPILHRASRGEPGAAAPTQPDVRFCPACGSPVGPATGGEAACGSCGSRFQVRYLRNG